MKKLFVSILAVLLAVTMLPISVMAMSVDVNMSQSGCDYYNLIEKNDYALAPGAVESEVILNDDTGSNRNVLHVIEVDLKNPNISVMPTYMGLREGIDFEDSTNWGSQVLTEQAAHVENNLGLNVVGGINTNLRYTSDHPYGVIVWNGVVYSDERNANGVSTAQTYLVVDKEGNAELRSASEPLDGTEWQAISANFGWILKDGVSQYATDDHADGNRAPRTVIGIKADGTLVLMMNDGRQSPYSAGSTMRELAEMLLGLGCVDAVNCDGGGSSTFISEREGTGELTMKSSPSDGGQRATLGGLLVISNAVADGQFDHATVKAEDSYVTPNSTVTFTATGADSAGGPADIPADVTWQLADSSMGTVENGVFNSNGTVGTATVQMVYGGEVVGEDSVNVVVPESITFVQENITVPYGKVVDIQMKATVNNGLNEVLLKDGDIILQLSDSKLGSVENLVYTACNEDAGVSSGTITAALAFDTSLTATAKLNLGKGSQVFWDFEDGDISSLSFASGYQSKHPAHPELGRFESGYIEVVDSTTGQVKNGDKALAVVCDWSNFYAMGYNMLRLSGLDVDLTDALRVGFWMYITPEATGMELDFENWYEFNHGDAGSDMYPEDGWYYVSVDATKISKSKFNNLNIYQTDGYDSATKENIPNIKTKHTVYIDDITVDYSTAVEDREAPTFTSVNVLKDADTYEAMEGQTVTTSKVTLMAEAKEDTTKNNYTGLNMSSAKVYVDGVQLTNGVSCSSNGSISVSDLELSDGTHTFVFEISDNADNARCITRQLIVDATDAEPEIALVPKDFTLDKLPLGSMYWMNLQVQNIENIDEVSTVIDLDGMNDWQLDYMEVADGFTAEYSVDDHTNNATISIKKTGKTTATGQTALVSIPIHIWSYDLCELYPDCISDGQGVCNFISTPAAMWSGDGQFRISLIINVDYGEVTFTDGTTDTFSSDNYVIDTEMDKHRNIITQAEKNAKTSWHIHTPVAVEDKAATCTENGYTGRTVCAGCSCGNTADNPCDSFDGCGSVVDWGTIIPATGHNYVVADGKFACEHCGELSEKNGIIEYDGNVYYAIGGNLKTGWIVNGTDYYYFDTDNYAAKKNGVYRIDNYDYTFNEKGVLTKGQLVRVIENGEFKTKYIFAGKFSVSQFEEIDGKTYWFDKSGFMATGTQVLKISGGSKGELYEIGDDGVVVGRLDYTGSYTCVDGVAYGFVNGKVIGAGVFENDGNTYFSDNQYGVLSTGKFYIDEAYATDKVSEGWHYADETGRFYNNEFVEFEDTLYYMVNGAPITVGAFEVDDKVYYADWNGAVKTGKVSVSESKTNGVLEADTYFFSQTGALCDNGFVTVDNDVYYVVDGKVSTTGVVEVAGDLYYTNWKGIVQSGKLYITEGSSNGVVTAGWYYTDETGKFYNDEFAEIDGKSYYMVNGQPKKQSGVVEIDGALYCFEWNGTARIGKIYITKDSSNGIVTEGWYYTNEAGKLYNNEFVTVDGNIYYMVNGQPAKYSGVAEIDGALYCFEWNGVLRVGKIYITEDSANEIVNVGWHYTDAAGKLYNNEFVTVDGATYYMVNGEIQKLSGVNEINGSLYCFEWNGALRVGKIYITEDSANEIVNVGWHYTDETGRLYNNEFATADGKIYYMVNGEIQKLSGVNEINGSLYCFEWNGAVRVGKIYVTEASANGKVTQGWYNTDANGRFYNNEIVEIDGNLYYLENGKAGKTGVIELDGAKYYVVSGGLVKSGKFYVTDATTNGLTTEGWHYADETGKFYNDEFVELDSNLYFIHNGQIAKLGVFEFEGNLYLSDTWNGKISRNGRVYVTVDSSNGLINWGFHVFDADGKMIG